MASSHSLQFLRPYVSRPLVGRQSPYLRFYHLATQYHSIRQKTSVRQQRRAYSKDQSKEDAEPNAEDEEEPDKLSAIDRAWHSGVYPYVQGATVPKRGPRTKPQKERREPAAEQDSDPWTAASEPAEDLDLKPAEDSALGNGADAEHTNDFTTSKTIGTASEGDIFEMMPKFLEIEDDAWEDLNADQWAPESAVDPYAEGTKDGRSAATIVGQIIAKAASEQDFSQSANGAAPVDLKAQVVKEGVGERSVVRKRVDELKEAGLFRYVRLRHPMRPHSIRMIYRQYSELTPDSPKTEYVLVYGRLLAVRTSGSKLAFLDIVQNFKTLQITVNVGKVQCHHPDQDKGTLKKLLKVLKRGDVISATGRVIRKESGQLTLEAIELPRLVTPSLVPLPEQLLDEDTRIQNRHVDLLVNKESIDNLRLRSYVIGFIRNALLKLSFTEVQTPILAANAGGAVARPFTTTSKAVPGKEIALRIAPELWLKRLVVGGMDRVFEIGPSFRNESADTTHNPEFTTCEFYATYFNLDELIAMSSKLLKDLVRQYNSEWRPEQFQSLPSLQMDLADNIPEYDFVQEIQVRLQARLPNLESPTALEDLYDLLDRQSHLVDTYQLTHDAPSLPKLLDRLAAALIEPLSLKRPIFIRNHPACMSPLAKSYFDRRTGMLLSARAELFYAGKEIANMYEEENDPFWQRRKFVAQARRKRSAGEEDEDGAPLPVDESYLAALESGLPPTGGFGCGIERLVMMLSGAAKIGDVLSFGNLRNVVALGSAKRQPAQQDGDDTDKNVPEKKESKEQNVEKEEGEQTVPEEDRQGFTPKEGEKVGNH
ncbi:uncharacterized protein E0L32_009253 [Thyridium curvatum]|uniref:Aminoacyl-transfer RNA synthetases class-II family profile domain-containing protein n=1 Tax=Thyridium curvatum TaxID=1093900 RepID=A0A507AZ44_9PEZI|nr:uncharacterized protein E0L32_009253 [Thyridium curvatum]TPX09510.1 hypothetical protein E0L32_009253 [Thyridium curvatum]